MTLPVATALLSGQHVTAFPDTDLPKAVALTGAATFGDGVSIAVWEWSLLPRDADNAGGLPADSLLDTTTVGDFISGKSSVQNPSTTLDVIGGFNFSLRVQNDIGQWSDPSFLGDNESCQAIVYILTAGGLRLPPGNMYRYEDDQSETLVRLAPGKLDLVLPSTVVAAIEALYDFDGGGSALTDRTANGHDLSAIAGTTRYTVCNRQPGVIFDGTHYLGSALDRAGLQIIAAITIEALVTLTPQTNFGAVVSYAGPGETAADNILYVLRHEATLRTHIYPVTAFHENAGGVNNTAAFVHGHTITGVTALLTMTRAPNGLDYKLYVDGLLMDSQSVGNAPTDGDGAATRLTVGAITGPSSQLDGVVHQVRITPEEFTAAEVREVARRVVGPV